jgi:hypothetical protein
LVPRRTQETQWIPQESRSREAGSAVLFFWVWWIAWNRKVLRQNRGKDPAMIALEFRHKVNPVERMRRSVIVAGSCNDPRGSDHRKSLRQNRAKDPAATIALGLLHKVKPRVRMRWCATVAACGHDPRGSDIQ